MTGADGFEAFLRRYQDLVFATAVRLLGRREEAEDVAQTVFLKAYERFEELAVSPTVAGWLKTVTTNACLNHLSRYRARWKLFSEMRPEGDEGGEAGFEERIASPAGDEGHAAEAGRADRLEAALQRLPDHQRVPLVLFHFEDQSYQDIAARLGVSLGKIKTDIHRGRLALKQALGDER